MLNIINQIKKALLFAILLSVFFTTVRAFGQIQIYEKNRRWPYFIILKRAGDRKIINFFDIIFKKIYIYNIKPGSTRQIPVKVNSVKIITENTGLLIRLSSPFIELISENCSAGMKFTLEVEYDIQPQKMMGSSESYWRKDGDVLHKKENLYIFIPLNDFLDQIVFLSEPKLISITRDVNFVEAVPTNSSFAWIESTASNSLKITGIKSGKENFILHYKMDGMHKIGNRDLVSRMVVYVAEEKYDMQVKVCVKEEKIISPQKNGKFIKIIEPANASICKVKMTEDGQLKISGNSENSESSTEVVTLTERSNGRGKILSIVKINLKIMPIIQRNAADYKKIGEVQEGLRKL